MSERTFRAIQSKRFKAEQQLVTVVLQLPANSVDRLRTLIRAYTMDGSDLPPELRSILTSIDNKLPKG